MANSVGSCFNWFPEEDEDCGGGGPELFNRHSFCAIANKRFFCDCPACCSYLTKINKKKLLVHLMMLRGKYSKKKVLPGFEPGSWDSESQVLTTTLQNRVLGDLLGALVKIIDFSSRRKNIFGNKWR